MKIGVIVAVTKIALMFLLVVAAEAAEIKVLSAVGMKRVMEDLGPKFERTTGHKLTIKFATLGQVARLVRGGETVDIVVLPQRGIDRFVKDGKVLVNNVTVIANSGVGLAVRKGSPKPDISSPESLKRTLLAAKSIAYTNPAQGGTSGPHFAKVLDRLGIAAELKPKTIFPQAAGAAAVGALVASGEAEIGVQQIQELLPVAGIEIVGPLPGDLQSTIAFSAAIMVGAKDVEASKALVEFLRTPEAAAAITAKGMEPAPL